MSVIASALTATACAGGGADYAPVVDGPRSMAYQADLQACQALARERALMNADTRTDMVLALGSARLPDLLMMMSPIQRALWRVLQWGQRSAGSAVRSKRATNAVRWLWIACVYEGIAPSADHGRSSGRRICRLVFQSVLNRLGRLPRIGGKRTAHLAQKAGR